MGLVRWLHLVLVVLLAGQLAGVTRFVSDGCVASCPDDDGAAGASHDDEGADCPPSCPTCACTARAAHVLPDATFALTVPVPLPAAAVPPVRATAPPSPDPHEILHVPIARLA